MKLPKLVRFDDEITLVANSGIQFVDFGVRVEPRDLSPGGFNKSQSGTALVRLDCVDGEYFVPGTKQKTRPDRDGEAPVDESLALLADCWLPIPVLRVHGGSRFDAGPLNWARARVVPLAPGEDEEGHTHRIVLAFDTNVEASLQAGAAYLAPTAQEVSEGSAKYAIAWRGFEPTPFLELPWVEGWLSTLFAENARARARADEDTIRDELNARRHQQHYLNVLWLLGSSLRGPDRLHERPVPVFNMLANQPERRGDPIQVDLALDVGNSRTVGILVENHPLEQDGLRDRYVLQLRDLSRPHLVYEDPFESRVEFAEAVFGKVDYSCQSGRNAFLWPTIARIGHEAARLASRRRGTEGSTGLSSPKRYLWDEERYVQGWRFNEAFNKSEAEPLATASPFSDLVNDLGDALYRCPDDLPVFYPNYTRSSLMTFMLAEVLAQALTQMNSPGQRMKQRQSQFPRHLRTVILTVPPSMPKPEREIFEDRVGQALVLVWKAMGWHPVDADPKDVSAYPPLPKVVIQWDEATCAQVVWLYSEIINHFGGRPEEFFQAARKPRPGTAAERMLRVASIDVGGGTTDLVVTEYRLDDGRGANVFIEPRQVFRDGFKVAGDDVVLEVINHMVVPAFEAAMRESGVADPGPVVSRMMGAEAGDIQEKVLRQQLTVQVLYPIALRLLKAYEAFNPIGRAEEHALSIRELLAPDGELPSPEVEAYCRRCVRSVARVEGFELLDVRIPFRMRRLHDLFINDEMEVCKTIRSLCEVAHLYDCDWLLLSGRPTRLPGVVSVFRALLPVPPDRILPMHNYRTGDWYPFSSQHRITDPKTTAVVGATLCMLCTERRLPNFYLQAHNLHLASTVRYLGMVDRNMTIKDEDVYYRDIDLDDPRYALDKDSSFEMRGPITLGFRQLATPRWGASPLYRLEFAPPDQDGGANRALAVLDRGAREGEILRVSLRRKPSERGYDHVEVERVTDSRGGQVSRAALRIRLMTLNAVGLEENSYWLDTGSIVR